MKISIVFYSSNNALMLYFYQVGTFTLIVNASNMVSWAQMDQIVAVMTRIAGLDIVSDSFIVAINDSIQVCGNCGYTA